MEYKNIINIKIKDFQLTENNTYKCLNKQFVDTEHLYVFDYNRGKIFHIDVPINTQNEDIPNILEEYGLKESECNYIVTEYPCKIINLTYEDKIVSKENKTQDNKVSSAPWEINFVEKFCSWDIISPLTLKDDEFQLIDSKGTCQNKRKSSIFKDPDGSIYDIDAFSKKPVGTYRFDTKTWEKNDKGITWNGGLFEHKDNVLTGRYFGICNIWNHETDKGYMPKPKRIIPCVEVEISPDNWIMAVSADSTELLLLSCDYNIKWEQVSCLKGIRLEDVTPELDSKAYAELKNNKH